MQFTDPAITQSPSDLTVLSDDDLLASATARLASVARELVSSLGTLESEFVRADQLLDSLCAALVPRSADASPQLHQALEAVTVDIEIARRLLIVAAELIGNAVRHGLADGGDLLRVVLHHVPGALTLTVMDNGRGSFSDVPMARDGLQLASEIVRRGPGWMVFDSNQFGTIAKLQLPLG